MPAPTDVQHAAELLELWRLCRKSSCRRARACRGDTRACCEMLVDWSEALSLKDKRLGFADAMERLCAGNNRMRQFLHQTALLHRGADEGGKERVRLEGPRFQLRVELHADEPGMVGDLDDLRQEPVRR